jgi:SP family galactose:H+ symporter-like MFS transporter
VFIGVINLAMTIVSLRLIGPVGRRALLLVSLTGMLVSLVLLGLTFVAELSSVITLACMLLYIRLGSRRPRASCTVRAAL